MIPPALHAVRVYPGLKLSTTIRATLYDAAAERRTLEELPANLAVYFLLLAGESD